MNIERISYISEKKVIANIKYYNIGLQHNEQASRKSDRKFCL